MDQSLIIPDSSRPLSALSQNILGVPMRDDYLSDEDSKSGISGHNESTSTMLYNLGDFKKIKGYLKESNCVHPNTLLQHQPLNIHSWNNIPIPVVQACQLFETCFTNISHISKGVIKDHQYRSQTSAKVLQKFDEKIAHSEMALQKTMKKQFDHAL